MKYATPIGISEFLPNNAKLLDEKKRILQEFFLESKFLPIKTPTIEFFESLEPGLGSNLKKQCIEFFDTSGKRLLLRPDNTTPIARIVATRMTTSELPIKLSYIEPVFRKSDIDKQTDSEIFQAGCEMIGYQSTEDVANVIALCIETLHKCGVDDLGIDIGHVKFVEGETVVKTDALIKRNYVDYGNIPARGKREVANGNTELETLYDILAKKGYEKDIFINQGLVKGLYYYSGVIFEIYSKKIKEVIASGGQYDQLCGKFGFNQPAVGFAICLNKLLGNEYDQ